MKMEQWVRDIDTKVTSILQLLKGHELDKDDKGLVGEISNMNTRLDKLEKLKDRMQNILIGMAVPASVGLWDFLKTLANLIGK